MLVETLYKGFNGRANRLGAVQTSRFFFAELNSGFKLEKVRQRQKQSISTSCAVLHVSKLAAVISNTQCKFIIYVNVFWRDLICSREEFKYSMGLFFRKILNLIVMYSGTASASESCFWHAAV